MKCSNRLLETYINNELSQEKSFLMVQHLKTCKHCSLRLKEITEINNILNSYQPIEIEDQFRSELAQIPYQTKKQWTLFSLLPRQLALASCLVIFALFSGVLVNILTMETDAQIYNHYVDIFDDVSLVSLLDF